MKSAHPRLAKGGRFLLLEPRGLVEINAHLRNPRSAKSKR
jgi:hypothetical protein